MIRNYFHQLVTRIDPAWLACLLALLSAGVALRHNAWTAGGSDAYSYVTQADLWLDGLPRVEVPLAKKVPWPNAIWTFTPFGYAPTADGGGIAPITGPGLPLMMAAMKLTAGHVWMFWVVPLAGALLVWTTFVIGRKAATSAVGLGAAWILATSPVFLMMVKSPLSDVPASAFWALAVALALNESAASAAAAGMAAAAAILIRPNLAPLSSAFAIWMLWARGAGGWRHGLARTLSFAAGALPGYLFVAWVNNSLFGGPLASGYGDLGVLFGVTNVPTNAARYGRWLIETQTPLAVLGIAVLALPLRRIWRSPHALRARTLLLLVLASVATAYAAYVPFEAWWFLRFLLPGWPSLCIGTAALVAGALGRPGRLWQAASAVVLLGLGLNGTMMAARRGVYPENEGERRYATVATLVQSMTQPSSAIFASSHAGPTRYYAGRLTLRFDLLDEAWLDKAVEWFDRNGRHPYFLLEDWELPLFERRFGELNRLGRLDLSPVLAYRAHQIPGTIYLFDPLQPAGQTWEPPPLPNPRPLCPLPAPAPSLD